jgi:hypothetical protein
MVKLGSGAEHAIEDFMLTGYANDNCFAEL